VARMTFTSAVVLAALAASSSAHAQQVRPEDSLTQATQLLAAVPASPGSGADQIVTLKKDFADFAGTYLAGPVTPTSATPGATGTSGRADARAAWRAKYQRVEADLAALLGPVGATASSASAIDPDTRARLESVRSRLQMFYAATLSQPDGNPVAHTGAPPAPAAAMSSGAAAPVAPTAEAPQTTRSDAATAAGAAPAMPASSAHASQVDTQWGTALALLDRMERILDDAIKETGKVALDRAAIDEMRAEVAQIRTMLSGTIKN